MLITSFVVQYQDSIHINYYFMEEPTFGNDKRKPEIVRDSTLVTDNDIMVGFIRNSLNPVYS